MKKNVVKLALLGLAAGMMCGCSSNADTEGDKSCSEPDCKKGGEQSCSNKTTCSGENGCTGRTNPPQS